MFEKSLTDLIRGIRANKRREDAYISQCLDDIRAEVRKNDLDVKASAIAKLFYLHMMGFDMSWASFHVIEVMASPKYIHKRIGYLAACSSFRQDTDVLMLCTNLIKKDLSSNHFLDCAAALNGLCTIVTPDLGRDLSPDLIAMLNHSKPYIRKRVILCLYKVFLKYPEALRVAYPRLKDRLDDPDPTVVSATVNVICELARKNPKSYLPLAPQLYNLLTNSNSNWTLIKIVKLFGALMPLEPRLNKKLMGPIINLIQTTNATSLLYECIHTIIIGGMITSDSTSSSEQDDSQEHLVKLCVSKLKTFIEDRDQNLKYLGLYALCKLLPLRPRPVAEHRDIILDCLDDKDISIRMRALELVCGMVTSRNVVGIVKKLLSQLSPQSEVAPSLDSLSKPPPTHIISDASYSRHVISRILSFCSKDTYAIITDFEWYVNVLVAIISVPRVSVGTEISDQLIDITIRVKNIREYAVSVMEKLIMNESIIESALHESSNVDALLAAGWIIGEFSSFSSHPTRILEALVSPKNSVLPFSIQAVYIQASLKLFNSWLHSLDSTQSDHSAEEFLKVVVTLKDEYLRLSSSADLEVQERASTGYHLLNLITSRNSQINSVNDNWKLPPIVSDLSGLFSGEFNPVAAHAQSMVPLPEGLDLDTWIHEPLPDLIQDHGDEDIFDDNDDENEWNQERAGVDEMMKQKRRQELAEKRRNDPYYIPSEQDKEIDSIPVVRLSLEDIPVDLEIGSTSKPSKKTTKQPTSNPKAKSKPPKKSKTNIDDWIPLPTASSTSGILYEINRSSELPENAPKVLNGNSVLNKHDQTLDADTLAVLSVDLTQDETQKHAENSSLGFEVRRATVLNSQAIDGGLVVTRKKVDGKLKKKKKDGTKSSKKDKNDEEKSEGGEKEKKSKKAVKKKKVVEQKEELVEEKDEYTQDSPIALPPSKFFDTSPDLILNSKAFKSVYSNDTISVGYDWQSHMFDPSFSLSDVFISLSVIITVKSATGIKSGRLEFTAPSQSGIQFYPQSYEMTDVSQGSKTKVDILCSVAILERMLPSFIIELKLLFNEMTTEEYQPIQIQLPIPSTLNLIYPPITRIDPSAFASLLAHSSNLFPYSASSQFSIENIDAFPTLLDALSLRLCMTVVEVVNGAASIYGESVFCIHVAGLVKVRPKANKPGLARGGVSCDSEASKAGIVSVEFRCGDKRLIDALVEEVNDVCVEL